MRLATTGFPARAPNRAIVFDDASVGVPSMNMDGIVQIADFFGLNAVSKVVHRGVAQLAKVVSSPAELVTLRNPDAGMFIASRQFFGLLSDLDGDWAFRGGSRAISQLAKVVFSPTGDDAANASSAEESCARSDLHHISQLGADQASPATKAGLGGSTG